MTDLTVLHGPRSLYPLTHGLFSQSTTRFVVKPHVSPPNHHSYHDTPPPDQGQTENQKPRGRLRPEYDHAFLSPPVNTWKSPHRQRRHRPTRSQSAPPGPDRRPKPEAMAAPVTENIIISVEALKPPAVRSLLPKRSYSSFERIGTTRGGELLPPPPPLRMYDSVVNCCTSRLYLWNGQFDQQHSGARLAAQA